MQVRKPADVHATGRLAPTPFCEDVRHRHERHALAPHDPLRIALIAPARSPIAQPFAGGLEAHVWTIAHALRDRGHDVTLYASPRSDPELKPVELASPPCAQRACVRSTSPR